MKALNIIHDDHPGLLAEVTSLLEKEGIAVQDFAGLTVDQAAKLLGINRNTLNKKIKDLRIE